MRSFLALVIVGMAPWTAFGGAVLQPTGKPLRWPGAGITLKISRETHLAEGTTGVDRRESNESVHSAVIQAIQSWTDVTGDRIRVAVELTDERAVNGTDNLVTFTDPTPFDNGTCDRNLFLACALLRYNPDNGDITNVSIAYNPYKRHSSLGFEGTNDIGLLMLHEMGHLLGLNHSAVQDAVMSATAEIETASLAGPRFTLRRLSEDDKQSVRTLYQISTAARLRGSVRRAGTPVAAASVIALDKQGFVINSTLSGSDGGYELPVPPGQYTLAAEPLDGPVLANSMVFGTLFWTSSGGDRQGGELVTVDGEQTRDGLDFNVAEGPVVNALNVGLRVNGSFRGYPRTMIARGRKVEIGLDRRAPGTIGRIKLLNTELMMDGDPLQSATNPNIIYQKAEIPADTPTGSYTLEYYTDDAISLMTASVQIVANPSVAEISEADSGQTDALFSPGQRLRIRGADLAVNEATGEPALEGMPRPNQLAGASVLVGDRFAPLVSVKPDEILAEIPAGLTGSTVNVMVVTGQGMMSEARQIQLAGN